MLKKNSSKKIFLSVLILISLIASAVCLTISAQNIETAGNRGATEGVITGIVTDAETNEPITSALMTLKYHELKYTQLTDSNGQYTFTNVPICFCLKNISASKSGYESQYQMVAINEITYVDFSLEPSGADDNDDNDNDDHEPEDGMLTGVVTDAVINEPIQNALMTLKYHEIVRTEFTDSNGQYTFTNVPICFCLKNISASKSGYESQYQLVGVSEMTYANFSLRPIDNPDEPEEPENPEDDGAIYGVLTGTVTDAETKEPLQNVLMTLIYHEIVRTVLTDSNGQYTFTKVPLCFCLKNLSASKNEYQSQSQGVAVSEKTNVDISLVPGQNDPNGLTDFIPEDNSDIIHGRSDNKETYAEPIGYYLAFASLLGTLMVILILGIYICRMKMRPHQ